MSKALTLMVVFCAAGSWSCNAMLGIDQASLDPMLAEGGPLDASVGDVSADGVAEVAATACESYCADVMTHCTGPWQEYLSSEICLKMCSYFEPGLPTDQSGDSRACRAYHAKAAAENAAIHCRHAGPLGGGVCGDNPCFPFCLLAVAQCGSDSAAPYPGGEGPCRAACSGVFAYDVGPTSGDLSKTEGDTLNCRLYHLQASYEPNNPVAFTTHCPHTAAASAVCN